MAWSVFDRHYFRMAKAFGIDYDKFKDMYDNFELVVREEVDDFYRRVLSMEVRKETWDFIENLQKAKEATRRHRQGTFVSEDEGRVPFNFCDVI
jgi:hypothetical protein